MLFRVLSVLFIVLGQIRVIWAFSECFRNCTDHLFEIVARYYLLGAAALRFAGMGHYPRTDFQNRISHSLLIRIAHMIRRQKALSKIFNSLCSMLYKSSRNIHVNPPQSSASFCLNSNGSEFSRFRCICSHCFQFTYISNKSLIKTKNDCVLI